MDKIVRLLELFDSSFEHKWEEAPILHSEVGLTSHIATFEVPIDSSEAIVGDLPKEVIKDLIKDGFNINRKIWDQKGLNPLDTPITAIMIEVEFATIHDSGNRVAYDPNREVYIIEFLAHLFTQKKYNPLSKDDVGEDDPVLIGTTYNATGLGNAPVIFSTIKNVVEDFIEQQGDKVSGLLFSGKGSGRQKVYRVFAKALSRQLGFSIIDLRKASALDFDDDWMRRTFWIAEDLMKLQGRNNEWYFLVDPSVAR